MDRVDSASFVVHDVDALTRYFRLRLKSDWFVGDIFLEVASTSNPYYVDLENRVVEISTAVLNEPSTIPYRLAFLLVPGHFLRIRFQYEETFLSFLKKCPLYKEIKHLLMEPSTESKQNKESMKSLLLRVVLLFFYSYIFLLFLFL